MLNTEFMAYISDEPFVKDDVRTDYPANSNGARQGYFKTVGAAKTYFRKSFPDKSLKLFRITVINRGFGLRYSHIAGYSPEKGWITLN